MAESSAALKSQAEVEKAFRNLRQKAKSLGITDASLARAKSLKNIQGKRVPFRAFKYVGAVVICILAVITGTTIYAFNKNYIDNRAVVELISGKLLGIDVEKDNCLIPIPELILDMFRPPVNCNMCRNVHQVDRVSNITPEEFAAKYAYSARPVVIVDGMKNWTASDHFSFDYFKSIYRPDSPVLKNEESCQFFPYQTKFESLEEVFKMPEKDAKMEGKPWYIGWSNCDSAAANELRKHYSRPYFLPEISESSKTDWIFMGCPGYGAHMHIDQVGKPSWQAQVKGTKKWTLQPPPECAFECKSSYMETIIHPGEIIVLDTNKWFHQTDIVNNELSITIGSEYD